MNPTTAKRRGIDLAAALQQAPEQAALNLTLAELVRAYNVAHPDGSDTRLRKWVDAFGAISAWEVTSEKLQIAADYMLEQGYSPASVNRDLSALGSAYRLAKKKRSCPRGFRSPTLDVPRFEEPIRRVEVSHERIEALRSLSLLYPDRRFGVFVSLLIDTGARKSELLERYGREFNLERREILAPTTKTDKPRVLFYSPRTAELIARVFPSMPRERRVFEGRVPGQAISYRKAWEACTKEAGLPDLHMHDVRHVAAASLLRADVTLPVAAQVLGHDPAVLARRYGHLETASLRQAQERAWQHAAT